MHCKDNLEIKHLYSIFQTRIQDTRWKRFYEIGNDKNQFQRQNLKGGEIT
jgi:hypothetical protein